MSANNFLILREWSGAADANNAERVGGAPTTSSSCASGAGEGANSLFLLREQNANNERQQRTPTTNANNERQQLPSLARADAPSI
jgi:hypothetical protein